MEFNIQSFGAGLGLVMIGWISGLVVSYLFSLNIGISRIANK